MSLSKIVLSSKKQLLILVFIALAINANTLFHQYVLDDVIVMTENKFVLKGIHGIPEILTQSYFKGYEKLANLEFSGGRYRPLALVVFAIEHQFFGTNPFVSHLINVLLFALLVALLFILLNKYIFFNTSSASPLQTIGKGGKLAFLTCLLFAVHPIHSEVIANVKSRDELITFILLIITLICLLKHVNKKNIWLLSSAMFCFFIALLTRESAATFVAVVPLILFFFYNYSIKKSILNSLPFLAIFVGYLLLRFSIVGSIHNPISDITNAPYLYATASEAFATKTYIILKYIGLLFLPHPLSFEYGYNQIPYIEITSLQFILSSLFIIALFVFSIFTLKRKSIFSFSILYFFITISLVANFIADTGTPLSERLLFQPSLAFCIGVSALYFIFEKKFNLISSFILFLILILFSVKTVLRNQAWKDYETLVMTDINAAPNSVRINQFATNIFLLKSNNATTKELRNEYLLKGAFYGERMLTICPKVPDTYMTLGYTYYNLGDYKKAAALWKQGCKYKPTPKDAQEAAEVLSTDLNKFANELYEQGKENEAIDCYKKSIEINNTSVDAWYNLGGAYYSIHDTANAATAWAKVKQLDPGHRFNKDEFINK